MRSSLAPGRSTPEPAPSSPSRNTTRPSHELSWNTRCVPASATTICTGIVRYSGSSPGPKPPFGSVFHSRYTPSRSLGPAARPPSPKNRASAATSPRCSHRAPAPSPSAASTGSHHRGGSSRRRTVPPGVRTSTAPVRDTATVTRSDTTRQPPSVSGSSTARGSGSGPVPTTAYEGVGPAPSQPQNTAPPTVTRTSSSDRANRSTPPPGRGSVPVSSPGTRARSAPRRASPTASARRWRHDESQARRPRSVPMSFTARTRSRPFMPLTLPPASGPRGCVQLPFTLEVISPGHPGQPWCGRRSHGIVPVSRRAPTPARWHRTHTKREPQT